MKHKILIYILSFLGFFAGSCMDDTFRVDSDRSTGEDDGLTISLKVDMPGLRTRAIDMTEGGGLYLNNIWIGVYNKNNGKQILTDVVDLHSRLTESGVTLTDVIKISVSQTVNNNDGNDYCVVGVANYEGILTAKENPEDADKYLIDELNNATTWDEFSKISIDTQQEIPNQTPVLMGYLTNDNLDDNKHTVIDQFSTNGGINVANQTDVFVSGVKSGNRLTGFSTDGYVMNLRRLRSKININLTPRDNDMTITNIRYKMVNVPKSSFLAERRTNTMDSQTGADKSPNSADTKNEGYITVEDAQWQKPSDNYSFSLEHCENKHWATETFSNIKSTDDLKEKYHLRGQQITDGVFSCLQKSGADWNNNASYIILEISLRDFLTGRNSTIEYTILEGFCNDADGNPKVDDDGNTKYTYPETLADAMRARLRDFSCFRNTDYTYNIHIESVDKIYLTVTESTTDHPYDQHNGNIWQMLYPEFTNNNLVKNKRITTASDASLTLATPIDCTIVEDNTDDKSKMKFEDIAFRFVGSYYDQVRQENKQVDLCYNVAHGDLEGYNGLWSDPVNGVTEYFVTTTQDNSTSVTAFEAMNNYINSHPETVEMLKRFTLIADGTGNTDLDITQFIRKLKEHQVNEIQGVNVKGIKLYELEEESDGPRNHMIGLYIFDRRRAIEGGDLVQTDKNGDCHYYQIRALEQYPSYLSTIIYERIYAKVNNSNRIPSTGTENTTEGTTEQINNGHPTQANGKYMIFSDEPDIAFRLVGYYDKDNNGEYNGFYDLCYNFDMDEYPGYNKFMPAKTYDTKTISKNSLTRENIPTELLNGIKIQDANNGQTYTIKQFISRAMAGNLSANGDYRFVFTNYGKKYYKINDGGTDREKSIRGIYIFDKKNRYKKPLLYNATTNEATYQMYAAEQEGEYVAPTRLPVPEGPWYYTKTATYNIIEEYVGRISIPLLDGGYTYNVDYYYNLYTLDPNDPNNRRVCKVEVNGTPSSGTITFNVPMSVAHKDTRDIYIHAVALHDRLLDNQDLTKTGKQTGTLINPEWDFTDDNWNSIFTGSLFDAYYNNNNKLDESQRSFNQIGQEYKITSNYFAPITFYANSANNLRGRISGDKGLYINSNGSYISTNIYKPCKVYLKAGPNENSQIDGKRGMNVSSAEDSYDLIYYGSTNKNDPLEKISFNAVQVRPGDSNKKLKITIKSGGGNLYSITLTD